MLLDFITPKQINNVLTAGKPLLRFRVGRVTFVREGAGGDLVQVPQTPLTERDRIILRAQGVGRDEPTGEAK